MCGDCGCAHLHGEWPVLRGGRNVYRTLGVYTLGECIKRRRCQCMLMEQAAWPSSVLCRWAQRSGSLYTLPYAPHILIPPSQPRRHNMAGLWEPDLHAYNTKTLLQRQTHVSGCLSNANMLQFHQSHTGEWGFSPASIHGNAQKKTKNNWIPTTEYNWIPSLFLRS